MLWFALICLSTWTLVLASPFTNRIEPIFLGEESSIPDSTPAVQTSSQFYLEHIKSRILEELGMKEAPKSVSPAPPIHTFRMENGTWYTHGVIQWRDLDMSARGEVLTSEIIPNTCFGPRGGPSCIRFQVMVGPRELSKISSSELWLYRTGSAFTIVQTGNKAQFRVEAGEPGWAAFDAAAMLGVLGAGPLELEIRSDSSKAAIETGGKQTPVLIVLSKNNRVKRSLDCNDGYSYCCKKDFKVNFEEIGWDWIIHPKVYSANICTGSCSAIKNFYTQVMKSVFTKGIAQDGMQHIVNCSPTAYAPLSVLYTPENSTVPTIFNFTDISVSSCGCI